MELQGMFGDQSSHPIQAPGKPYHRQRQPESFLPSDLVSRLVTAEGSEVFLPAGWSFSAYDADLQHHYTIPSHQVTANGASLKYTLLHERYGQGTRYRFQLCTKYLEGRCDEGKQCAFIHAKCDALVEKQVVHVNENLADCTTTQDVVNSQKRPRLNTHNYRLLPEGRMLAVHAPNAVDEAPQLFESGSVLHTQGGLAAYRLAQGESASENTDVIPVARGSRPRHCAHFQFRKVCHAGEECLFVHSLAPYVQARFRRPGEGGAQPEAILNQPPEKHYRPPAREMAGRSAPQANDSGRSRMILPPDYTEHLRRERTDAPPSPGVVFTTLAPNPAPSAGMMVAFLPQNAMMMPCATAFGGGIPFQFPYAFPYPMAPPGMGGLVLAPSA